MFWGRSMLKPVLLVYSKGILENSNIIVFKIKFSCLCFWKLDHNWKKLLDESLKKSELNNYQISSTWTHAKLRITFPKDRNIIDFKSDLIRLLKESIVEVNLKLRAQAREINDTIVSQKKKTRNLKLLNKQFENKYLNTEDLFDGSGITDKDLIIVISANSKDKNLIPLNDIKVFLMDNPKYKILLSFHNIMMYKKLKKIIGTKSIKPLFNFSKSKLVNNNQILDPKIVLEKRLLQEQKKVEKNKKIQKYIKRSPIAFAILVLMAIIIFYFIDILLYDRLEVNNLNYSNFIELEVFIDETSYYLESNEEPSKYIYTVNPIFNQLTQTELIPDLIINFTDDSGSKEVILNELTFENDSPINNVNIRISPDFNESHRFLKSDLRKLDFNKESIDFYEIELSLTDYYYKEVSINSDNVSEFLEFLVENPLYSYISNVYQETIYSISIIELNNVIDVLELTIEVLYKFSDSGYGYNVNSLIEFQLDSLTNVDRSGDYTYYIYEIQTVQGTIVIKEDYNQ